MYSCNMKRVEKKNKKKERAIDFRTKPRKITGRVKPRVSKCLKLKRTKQIKCEKL